MFDSRACQTPRSPSVVRIVCSGLVCVGFSGCEQVEFYERGAFASPLMAFDDDSTRVHAMQKVFYSREASVGGIGSTAGGGCGCTN